VLLFLTCIRQLAEANKRTPKKQLQKITGSQWPILYITCEKFLLPFGSAQGKPLRTPQETLKIN